MFQPASPSQNVRSANTRTNSPNGFWDLLGSDFSESKDRLLRPLYSRLSKYGKDVDGPLLLIASYPRSGNHLVRFLIEFVTGRPTLGCYKNREDLPISQGSRLAELRHVTSFDPIGHKAHFADEIHSLRKLVCLERMLLIQRDPVEAILSHRPLVEGVQMSDYLVQLRRDIIAYNALIETFRSWTQAKWVVSFERLVGRDGATEFSGMLDFLDLSSDERAETAVEEFYSLRESFFTSERPPGGRPFSKSRSDPNYYRMRSSDDAVNLIANHAVVLEM